MKVQRDGKYFKCQFCALRLENYQVLCQHLHLCHNVIFLVCQFCDCKYLSKIKLEQHIKISHTDGQHPRFECSRCPATFKTEDGLRKHTNNIHIAERPTFPCKKCDKVYMSKQTYSRHIKLAHRPLKFIKCDECPKIFYKKQNLKRHMEVNHSADYERTKCPLCFATFKYKEHISRHMQSKHYNKARSACDLSLKSENKCKICAAQFPNKTALLQHEKTFHNKDIDIYECEECTAIFKIREAYEFHVEEEHGMLIDTIKSDGKDIECQDFVDFEETIMKDFDLLKLIEYRKMLKPHQRIEIVMEDNESDKEDILFNIEAEELVKISENIHTFFYSFCNEYRLPDISEKNNFTIDGNEQKCETEPDYIVIEISGQSNDNIVQLNKDSGQLNEHSIEVKDDSGLVIEDTVKINNDSDQINCDITHSVDVSGLSAVCTDDDKENIELITEVDKEELNLENLNYDPSNSQSSVYVEEVTIEKFEEEETSVQVESYPKISYFHCLECNDQFPKEDQLWIHLTRIHGRLLKSPATVTTTKNSKKEVKILLNRIDGPLDKSKAIDNDALYIEFEESLLDSDDNLLLCQKKQIGPKSSKRKSKIISVKKSVNKRQLLSLKQDNVKKRKSNNSVGNIPKKKLNNTDNRVAAKKGDTLNTKTINESLNKKPVCLNNSVKKSPTTKGIKLKLLTKLPYVCNKCKEAFKTKMQLKKHNENKHIVPFKCNDCDKIFKIKAILVRHSKYCLKKSNKKNSNVPKESGPRHTEDASSMFLCEECEALFPNMDLLQSHRLWEHEQNVTLHKCCHCGMIYNQLGDFEKHLETVHNEA